MRKALSIGLVALSLGVSVALSGLTLQRAGGGTSGDQLMIWNDCGGPCVIPSGGFFSAGLPAQFAWHFDVAPVGTTDPVTVGILTSYGFADFIDCFQSLSYSEPFRSYHCLDQAAREPGSHVWTGSSLHLDFTDAEGCAGYISVLVTLVDHDVPITPAESVHYAPAGHRTGICAKDPYL